MIKYEELRHFGPENFALLVDAPSTKRKLITKKDQYDRLTEQVVFFRGSRILGMQVRDMTGYRYYVRK